MDTIGWVVKTFVKATIKSASIGTVVAATFLFGREVGHAEERHKMKEQLNYYEEELEREGYPNASRRGQS